RHEVLRTTFASSEGRPQQVISPAAPLTLLLIDLGALPGTARAGAQARWLRAEAGRGFDLERGPLLRVRLLRTTPADHALVATTHHIIADGWSIGILIRELGDGYMAVVREKREPTPSLAVQYGDFAVWQRRSLQGAELERQLAHWRARLAGAP